MERSTSIQSGCQMWSGTKTVGGILLEAFLGACGLDGSATDKPNALVTEAPAQYIDGSGRVFVKMAKASIVVEAPADRTARMKKAKEDRANMDAVTDSNGFVTYTFPKKEPSVTPDQLVNMSDEDAAQYLRSVVLWQGNEYTEAELPIALAQKVKADINKKPLATPGFFPSATPAALPPTVTDTSSRNSSIKYIIGDDDRTDVSSDYSWPNRTQVKPDGLGCSATLISAKVAVTAAHCIYDQGNWYVPDSLTPARNDSYAPYGSWGNFALRRPSQYWHNNYEYDYAVIEFPSSTPGDTVGWLGTSGDYSGTINMVGYPGDKGGLKMWKTTGTVTGTTDYRLKYNLDTQGGNSGGGVYVVTSDHYLVGIHGTQNFTETCFLWWCWDQQYWNEGIRWTTTTHNFFAAAGFFPTQ